MLIEDSNKDNYKQNSEQFDHKIMYLHHTQMYLQITLTMTACSRKTRRCTVRGESVAMNTASTLS